MGQYDTVNRIIRKEDVKHSKEEVIGIAEKYKSNTPVNLPNVPTPKIESLGIAGIGNIRIIKEDKRLGKK